VRRGRRGDIARRRWIGDAVHHALTLDGTVEERAQAGMEWVDCGVERGDTGIGVRTMARAHREWDAWRAEVARRIEATPPEVAAMMYEQASRVRSLLLETDI
jgi:hypothetical protein